MGLQIFARSGSRKLIAFHRCQAISQRFHVVPMLNIYVKVGVLISGSVEELHGEATRNYGLNLAQLQAKSATVAHEPGELHVDVPLCSQQVAVYVRKSFA